jgi:leader peptidase (prepilin peptidase)/N-methyltransferase
VLSFSTLLLILAAPVIGSFLGLLTMRLPINRPIILGRSECDHCAQTLGPLELVPLFSYVWLGARCRRCGEAIDAIHPVAELGALIIALWAALVTSGWWFVATCVFGWLLLTLALTDWRALLLPDLLTFTLLAVGLLTAFFLDRAAFINHAIAAIAGFLIFAGIAFAYESLRGRPGLGLGDAKLLAGLGAWVSWDGLPSVVLLAAVFGLALALSSPLLGRKVEPATKLPFGTFLALAGWLMWLYGPFVLNR